MTDPLGADLPPHAGRRAGCGDTPARSFALQLRRRFHAFRHYVRRPPFLVQGAEGVRRVLKPRGGAPAVRATARASASGSGYPSMRSVRATERSDATAVARSTRTPSRKQECGARRHGRSSAITQVSLAPRPG